MTACAYTPSAEHPTYEDYRKAKQREHRKAWKKRNQEKYRASEYARNRERYASDNEYRAKVSERNAAAYRADPSSAKDRAIKRRLEKPDECSAANKSYYLTNKPAIQAYKGAWAKANASRVNSRNAARRALCGKATPAWANKQDIADVYAEARHMQMHVDHIVPLNHPLVCGLHVWDNLQLLSPVENMRKSNKFDPEIPHGN